MPIIVEEEAIEMPIRREEATGSVANCPAIGRRKHYNAGELPIDGQMDGGPSALKIVQQHNRFVREVYLPTPGHPRPHVIYRLHLEYRKGETNGPPLGGRDHIDIAQFGVRANRRGRRITRAIPHEPPVIGKEGHGDKHNHQYGSQWGQAGDETPRAAWLARADVGFGCCRWLALASPVYGFAQQVEHDGFRPVGRAGWWSEIAARSQYQLAIGGALLLAIGAGGEMRAGFGCRVRVDAWLVEDRQERGICFTAGCRVGQRCVVIVHWPGSRTRVFCAR